MSISCEPFVAIGTGRCGTHSLYHILKDCGLKVKHEQYGVPWYEPTEHLGKLIRDFKSGDLHCNVACYLLPHISKLRSAFPGMKVIHLWRDLESFTESWMNMGMAVFRPGDRMKWLDNSYADRASAARCFPLIDAATKRQAVEFYWEMYTEMALDLDDPVFRIRMHDLNDDDRLNAMYDFLGLEDRAFPDERRFCTASEIDETRKEMQRARV